MGDLIRLESQELVCLREWQMMVEACASEVILSPLSLVLSHSPAYTYVHVYILQWLLTYIGSLISQHLASLTSTKHQAPSTKKARPPMFECCVLALHI